MKDFTFLMKKTNLESAVWNDIEREAIEPHRLNADGMNEEQVRRASRSNPHCAGIELLKAQSTDGQSQRQYSVGTIARPLPDSVSNPCRVRVLDYPQGISGLFSGISFARVWKHVAMIFAVLVMSIANIGTAWGVDYSSTPLVSLDFSSSLPTVSGVTYNAASYSSGKISWSGNYSKGSRDVQIAFTTTGGHFKLVIGHVTSGSSMTFKYTLDTGSAQNLAFNNSATSNTYEITAIAGSHTISLGPGGSSTRTVVTSIAIYDEVSGSTWYVKGDWNGWNTDDNLTGSGTTLSKTINITSTGSKGFKVYNSSGDTWYGNNGNIGGNVSNWTFSTSDGDCHLLVTETGNYTFSFNTSTKQLSITYPNSYTFYYANSDSWSNVYVYKFTSISDKTGTNAAWPGTQIASPSYTCGGTDYYAATSDGYAKLIFTNNSGNQTGDMVVSSSDAGKYVGGTGSSWSAFPTYTVTYNKNGDGAGGAGSVTGSVPTDSNSPYACGSTVTVLGNTGSLALDGYTFAGWNTAPGGGGTSYAADATFTISANTTLYAQWELIQTYDVIYNTNGGTGGSTASQTGNLSGAQVTTRANGFTRSGYKFKWWNTAANGSGEDFYPGEKVTIASADVNLYAQWEEVGADWEFWVGEPSAWHATTHDVTVGDMNIKPKDYSSNNNKINTDLTADATIVSATNKHAIVMAVADDNLYVEVSFTDGSPINTLKLGVVTKDANKDIVVCYSTTADFSTGEYEFKKVGSTNNVVRVPDKSQSSKATLTDVSPSTANKYKYARVYRKLSNGTDYNSTGAALGSGNTTRIYAIKAEKGHICAAPTELTVASTTAKGTTFTVTDGDDTNNYEFYVSTESTAPTAGSSATYTSTSKTKTIDDLYAGTQFYAWVRSNCGVYGKSGWTALTGNTFTTSTVTVTHTLSNVTKTSGATTAGGSDYTAVYSADTDYSMPTPSVTIGDNSATSGTDYTWTAGTGTITIPANKITGNIVITLSSAAVAPTNVAISGTYHYYPGETISLTATATGGNGPKTYQWYKGGTADGNAIEGATSATFSKTCVAGDAGAYYCKVTCGGSASTWSDGAGHNSYDVKIMQFVLKNASGVTQSTTPLTKVDATHATIILHLTGGTTYKFRITDGCGNYYGNTGTMTNGNSTDWYMNADADCGMTTGLKTANYTFNVTLGDLGNGMQVTAVYPGGDQAAGKIIYWDNSVLNWADGAQWYRIGKSTHHNKIQMTKVSGTANLYKVTTIAYNGFEYWHIANNQGNGDGNLFWTKGDAAKAITNAMDFEGAPVTLDVVTVTPTTSHATGETSDNDNCQFYTHTTVSGMKTDNVAITAPSHGTLTVNYVDVNNTAQAFSSGNRDLAHTCIITVTAVPGNGYVEPATISINGSSYGNRDPYTLTGNIVVSADFSPATYTVTLNTNEGTINAGNVTEYTFGVGATLPTNVTKTGYTFDGWYDNAGFTGSAVSSITTSDFGNKTYWAKWTINNYNLTWNLGGGITTSAGTGIASGVSANTTTSQAYGTALTFPTVTKTGYNFGGWSPTVAGSMPAEAVTYTATWTAKQCTVSFDNNGGTGGTNTVTATYGSALPSKASNLPTKTGYTFAGYYDSETDNDGTGTKYYNADGTSAQNWDKDTESATTLYAKWTVNSHTLTWDFDGGSSSETAGTHYTAGGSVNYGASITYPSNGSMSKPGNTFTGWSSTPSTMPDNDLTITAQWADACPAANSGEVVYKFVTKSSGLGTSAICTNKDQDYPLTTGDGKPLETLTNGTLTARASTAGTTNLKYNVSSINFNGGSAGWLIIGLDCAIQSGDIIRYVNSNSGSVAIHTAKGTSTNEIVLAGNSKTTIQTVVISAAQATAFNGLKTIYMERKSNSSDISYFEIIRPYVVTLDANTNGGKVGGANTKTMYFVADEAQLLPRATKSDYLFKGWFNASSGGDAVANPYTATTSPKTLYAQFDDCSSTSGTVYKIQVKTGLTNGSIAAGDLNEGNYLSAMDGGTAVITGSHAQIVNNNAIDFKDNGDYITVNLDCELKAGDYFKTTISGSKSGIKVTTTGSTTSLQNISYGTNVETEVPASLVGSKTFRIYRQDSNCGGLSYFEIVRPAGSEVTYNNGGHGVAPSSTTAAAVTLADISVTGWKNTGWKADVDVKVSGSTISAGTEIAVGTVVTILEATTFTAQWVDCCFEFTSSSQESSVSSVAVSGNVTASLWEDGKASLTGGTITNSGTATLGINKTYGMVFDGSTKEITVTLAEGHALGVGSVITISAGVSDASGSQTSGMVVNGNTCSPASYTSSTAGYGFTQSYTVTALDGLAGRKSFTIAKKSDLAKTYLHGITVTGCAEVTGYTIAFEGNGNTGGSMSDVTEIEEGDDVTLAANGFTKNGYTFANWTADVAVTVNSATVAAGDPIADEATIQNVTSDITLTAQWTPNNYTITYNLNGASWAGAYSAPANYTVGTGATLPVAGNMTNTGYTFGGWFDNSSCTGVAVTTISTSDFGNKEYWAKWTENTYTITYNANGGTGSMTSTTGHYVTIKANEFTKDDYIFAGWNTAGDGSGLSYSAGQEVELTANMTLYAQWGSDYTITWDASAKLGGVTATPNLGGGNYTITASVATWNGTLTAGMISALTDGVTITNVEIDNSASPKTITATFNVGASVAGTSISLELDVPAYGVYGAKSSPKEITIDRCTGSSVGVDGVLFSAEFKDSGLGTSNICAAANTPYTFTTAELKSASTGGSIKAYTTDNVNHMKLATNAISIAGSNGVIQIDLDNAIQTYDLFTYVNVNSSSSSAYLRHTSADNTTDQIALTVYNSKEVKVMLPAGYDGKTTLYLVRNSNNFNLHKAAVVRPAFLMLLRDDTPTSDTNLEGTDMELTTGNYLTTIQGGHAYYTSPSSGNLKIKRSSSKNYINFNNAAGYVKIVLNDALQEGDVIGFDSYNTNNLALTTTATRSTSIVTTNQLYTVDGSSALKGATTFYIWQYGGSSDYLRGLQIARSGAASGGGGTDQITPTLTWTPALNTDGDWDSGNSRLNKETGDADFTFTVTQDKNSLGAITYSSSNTSVATVNATSGKVHVVGAGNATITATMAESGCYAEATASYNITVADNCDDVPGTIGSENLGCSGIRLTVTGHTTSGETVSYQWYRNGVVIDGATSNNYTAKTAGEYYVIVTNTGERHCPMASENTVTIEATGSVSATKIVDSWYVKNGRRTPDIALIQTTDASAFTVKNGSDVVIWNSDGSVSTGFANCPFHLGNDGIIYLNGQTSAGAVPTGLTAGDETLTITVSGCSGSPVELSITIHKQAATMRPSVAFVVDGTKEGDFDEEEENHSVTTALYQFLDYGADEQGAFDLTGQNVYSTVDEKAIREHYSQFDAILITDDPSTDTKIGKKSCVNAFGTMIDVRPILTMEAFVAKWSNWKAKGIDGDPTSPNPRQYAMKLDCKDHAIFKGIDPSSPNVETEIIDGVEYWTVTVVDNTKSPYSGLADNSKTDETPALQGFSASDVSGLLLLGEISDGALYAGVERQEEPAARLMLLGLNNKALPSALTEEGKQIIENALKYLIETDMEKVDDCSNYFVGTTSDDWNLAANWSKNHVPNSPNVRARILSPCVVYSGTFKVAEIDIATSGKSLNKVGDINGKLTVNAGAALIVGGKIRTAEAPYFNTGDLKPTTVTDLVINNTSGSNQAALVFNNDKGDTKATVNLYSLGRKIGESNQFQYFAIPMTYLPVNPSFAGAGIYTYVWEEASGWERRGYYTDLYAFEGVGITTNESEARTYNMAGTLASTATKEIPLTADNKKLNLVGNSWTAPIQISQLSDEDFSDAANVEEVIYIYCAGSGKSTIDGTTETAGQWLAIPFEATDFAAWEGLKVIPAMQSFQIKVSDASTMTLDYSKHVRGATTNLTEKLRSPQRKMENEDVELMRIRVADSKTHTDLYLFEGNRFSDAFDNGWEANYRVGDNQSAKLYARTSIGVMAVAAMSNLEGTQVYFIPGQETEYTFTFGGNGMGYYLNDLKLQKSTLINEWAEYRFTYETGDAAARFMISATPYASPQITTDVGNTDAEEMKVLKVIYNDKLYIIRGGRVYSAEGALVK